MADLDKLFEGFKAGRMKYPQPRRASEDEFFAELVARIKAIEARCEEEVLAEIDKMTGATPDRMAAARAAKAAKAAKRDAPPPEAA